MAAAFFRISLSAVAVAIATLAQAQHQQPAVQGHALPSVAAAISSGPFSAEVYGAFRSMMQKDNSPKIELGQAMSKGTNIAVGAVSDLRGEITVVDGKPVISYGKACPSCPVPHAEKATLLATAKVVAWADPVSLPETLSGQALDGFIITQAKKAGLNIDQPFPIRIKGKLVNVKMHVIASPNPKFTGHGSNDPMAIQEDIRVAEIDGEVVAIYAPEPQQGIITHPGEPFHYHWVDTARTQTAHLDAFGMAKGAQLILPKN